MRSPFWVHSQLIPASAQIFSTAERSSVWKKSCHGTSMPSEKLRTYIKSLRANSSTISGSSASHTSRQSSSGVSPCSRDGTTQKKNCRSGQDDKCELSLWNRIILSGG